MSKQNQQIVHPTVTIALTTYNRAAFLKEALDSVLAQTYTAFQVVIFDNGSTDGTVELADGYAAADERVRIHRQIRNIGAGANIRVAFFSVETEYTAWLMDDDIWLPDHLEKAMEALTAAPKTAFYACGARVFGDGSDEILQPRIAPHLQSLTTFDFTGDFSRMLVNTAFVGSSVVFRTAFMKRLQLWCDVNPAIDWLIWGQLALQGPVAYDPTPRILYRRHGSSDSSARLGGRRGVAQSNYIRRMLATLALEGGALRPEQLRAFLSESQDLEAVRSISISLSTFDAPALLRSICRRILRQRPEISYNSGYRLFEVAYETGGFLFPWFDVAYRVAGRWWPQGRASLQLRVNT